MKHLKKYANICASFMERIGGLALCIMTILICAHVILRGFFDRPIEGTFEITGYLAVIAIPFGLASAAIHKRHIAVDVFVKNLPLKIQFGFDIITGFFNLLLFSLITWNCYYYATRLWKSGDVSTGLKVPYYCFAYGVAACSTVMCFILLIDLIETLKGPAKQ